MKAVSREVKADIAKAKMNYRKKIEIKYSSGDLRAAWQGIKTMASINQCTHETKQLIKVNGVDDTDLSDTFNSFFVLRGLILFLKLPG